MALENGSFARRISSFSPSAAPSTGETPSQYRSGFRGKGIAISLSRGAAERASPERTVFPHGLAEDRAFSGVRRLGGGRPRPAVPSRRPRKRDEDRPPGGGNLDLRPEV